MCVVALCECLTYTFGFPSREWAVSEHDWITRAWWFVTGHSQVIRDIALALAATIGLPLVIWRTWATHQQSKAALVQAKTASERHEQQTDADRQRRITESFARAIEQLGSEKLEVRLGAIYALERIARESPGDHWPIMETLTAYVREKAPWRSDRIPWEPWTPEMAVDDNSKPPAHDIQAVLTVISRRRQEHDPERQRINLTYVDLKMYDLSLMSLCAVNFSDSRLAYANLTQVDLRDALLRSTNMYQARLWRTRLDRADLSDSGLGNAWLDNASLRQANLRDVMLDRAIIANVDLQGAKLRDCSLRGAHLSTCNVTQEQLNTACGDAKTEFPEGLTIPLCGEKGQPIKQED